MRLIHLYLVLYFVLVVGAGVALVRAGALNHGSAGWVILSFLIAIALGVVLAVSYKRPTAG
jgi:hypothetical protein